MDGSSASALSPSKRVNSIADIESRPAFIIGTSAATFAPTRSYNAVTTAAHIAEPFPSYVLRKPGDTRTASSISDDDAVEGAQQLGLSLSEFSYAAVLS